MVASELRPRPLARSFEAFGNLEPRQRLPLAAELGGRLSEVHPNWRPGGEVAEGELVFALDPRPFELVLETRRAEREEARASIASARTEEARARRAVERFVERRSVAVREHERLEGLVAEGVVSESTVDQALTARIAAEWEVENGQGVLDAAVAAASAAAARSARAESALLGAEDQLQRTRFHAPFAGAFAERGPEPGSYLTPGQPLGELYELDRLLFTARVPADELLFLREGIEVKVELAGRPELTAPFVLEGKIVSLSPRVDTTTRHGMIEIEVLQPLFSNGPEEGGPQRIPAGLFARAELELEPKMELWIDREHFAWRNGVPTAFVVEDGRARARELVLDRESGEGFTIAGGLSEGDLVITAPLERLEHDAPVDVTAGAASTEENP